MLTSIRRNLSTVAMAMAPFLLSACGGDDDGQQKFEAVVLLPLFFFVFVTLASRRGKAQVHVAA